MRATSDPSPLHAIPARRSRRQQSAVGSTAARPSARDRITVRIARASQVLVHATGRAGTSFPGLVAERLSPGIGRRQAARLDRLVAVSGTNGKTTTTSLLARILRHDGREIVTNASGSNLPQGMTTALLSLDDRGRDARRVEGVVEVDETALPGLIAAVPETVVVLTNLFRDQLDRFGETDRVVDLWRHALARMGPRSTVVYCVDDPRLTALVEGSTAARRVGYGLAGPPATATSDRLTLETPRCPTCAAPLSLTWTSVGHLGDYHCPGCGFRRPEPWLSIRAVDPAALAGHELPAATGGQRLAVRWADERSDRLVTIGALGTANAYNAAAALAAATTLGLDREAAISGLDGTAGPYGRFEALSLGGRRVVLALAKNPVSLEELTQIGSARRDVGGVLFALNDGFADGRDVSWYWDADPTALVEGRAWAVSGSRAADMDNRLKYGLAACGETPGTARLGSFARPMDGLARVIDAVPVGATVLVVASYTALLPLRAALVALGLLDPAPM